MTTQDELLSFYLNLLQVPFDLYSERSRPFEPHTLQYHLCPQPTSDLLSSLDLHSGSVCLCCYTLIFSTKTDKLPIYLYPLHVAIIYLWRVLHFTFYLYNLLRPRREYYIDIGYFVRPRVLKLFCCRTCVYVYFDYFPCAVSVTQHDLTATRSAWIRPCFNVNAFIPPPPIYSALT